ncbi:hypothetical protein [Sporosarcina cyprini]|uniref:hypothetical protein n=1 Tax=Sporosarcina cyprini TaxID=2910523 RepID=UPI001EDF8C83|nr:hypothetical protein [Sporosarcina cyprini]MCG3087038.1 hypothetical protein [Sporosarcina cyprini]
MVWKQIRDVPEIYERFETRYELCSDYSSGTEADTSGSLISAGRGKSQILACSQLD